MVDFIEQCGLIDMGLIDMFFTWSKKVNGVTKISKRLDRALADCEWRVRFPEAFVENLFKHQSYHRPMLLHCNRKFHQKLITALDFRLHGSHMNNSLRWFKMLGTKACIVLLLVWGVYEKMPRNLTLNLWQYF